MKRISVIIILSIIVLSIILPIISAQIPKTNPNITMKERWKTVESYSVKQLPESALKEVEIILEQARNANDLPQMIKAMIHRMKFITAINYDETIPLILEFEDTASKTEDPAAKAVMYSMTAQMYYDYYQSNRFNIDQRTPLTGFVPADVKEWTKNIFTDKIIELTDISLQNKEALRNTDVLKYEALLITGKDSRIIKPTLFDFLAYRKIDLYTQIAGSGNAIYPGAFALTTDASGTGETALHRQILDTYDQIIAFQKQKNNKPATVYGELQKLKFEHNATGEAYLNGLNQLQKTYNDNEAVVEILVDKANYYRALANNTEAVNAGEKNKKKAYEITQEGIKRFPGYKRVDLLKNIQKAILSKSFTYKSETIAAPGSDLKIEVTSTNIEQLKLQVYKVEATALEYRKYKLNEERNYKKSLYPKRTLVSSQTIDTKRSDNFDAVDTAFTIKTGDFGIYEFLIEEPANTKDESRTIGGFTVTGLAFIERQETGQTSSAKTPANTSGKAGGELYVLNRISGKPISDVTISVYNQKWGGSNYSLEFIKKVSASSEGKYSTSDHKNNDIIIFFEHGNDKYFTSETQTYWYANNRKPTTEPQISIFTDRSLYRPGQTVYYKGIAYISTNEKQQTVDKLKSEIRLYNANGEQINKQDYTTNEFGSFAGSFILPETGLNGAFRLQSGNSSINIWVEEYKRPTFEVTIEQPKTEVRFGEEITVRGNAKAYSGYNITGADVSYRVVRRPHSFWWWRSEPDKIITTGTVKSDSEGNFDVKFTPEKDKDNTYIYPRRNRDNSVYYTYFIYAVVTDSKGETQQSEQSLSVGDKSLFILAYMPERIDKNETTKLDVTTQTLNGETVLSTVNYKVVRLKDPVDYYEKTTDETEWKEASVELTGTLQTNNQLELDLKKLASGAYKIIFTTKDNRNNEVKKENMFVLYGKNDKQPPVKTYKWFVASNTDLSVGEKAVVSFGTSTKNTFVLYEIMKGDSVLENRWIEMNNEIKTFEIPFEKNYGPGVTVQFTFVKDEQMFNERITLTRKTEEKKLTPSVAVFRDKLKPGENAEWTIHIAEAAKDHKTAELLIGMYDASLDAIRPHNWTFHPTYIEQIPFSPVWRSKGINNITSGNGHYPGDYKDVPDFQFDVFNWFGLDVAHQTMYVTGATAMRKSLARNSTGVFENEMIVMDATEEVALQASAPETMADKAEAGDGSKIDTSPQVRINFNETAFFYPQLRTDADGNVKVSFITPESLTRWNVKMLAHTKDLYFGQNEFQAVTQKELMVQMNLPRFVRKSDKLVLSANVVNLSDKPLTPELTLEIIDPSTEKVIQAPAKLMLESIDPKGSKAVQWELDALKEYDLVVARVIAKTPEFSDGEQKYLPVLPDKVLITESLTMTLRAGQTRTFTFDNFINNLKSVNTENFTVEYAGNPTWFAVQALPSIAHTEGGNAIDYLTGYYANTLGSYIANANPALAATFERWKKAGGTRDALLSNIEKNQELKNMLLEETPWVMAAKDETEQKRQIGLLFDLNQTQNQAQTYLDKLTKLQGAGGGFSWFEGMPENRYITQEILLNLARMFKMTKKDITADKQIWGSVKKALEYTDLQIAKDLSELKKHNKNYLKEQTINNMQLLYLHTRSEYKQVPIHKSAVEAVDYFTMQSEKYWTSWTLYGKAMMATVAYRNSKSKLANEILASIREHALKTDELGMYWTTNKAGWWWYERPIATQTAVMEAFGEIRNAVADIDEMKIWLLKQKQTQRWDTPISTLDAIYALLNYGTDWLSNKGEVEIKLGDMRIEPQSVEAGTAYIKETIPVETLKPEMGRITVESRSSSGISWGAAYWQYYQDIDKIKSSGKEMNISKKLFVERITDKGKSMLPAEQTTLKTGDKIITRLVVTTDRDLEFVALKDLRAACFEPVNQLSGISWKEGVIYYQTHKDASTQFFFNYLPKGTYVFEYELWVNNAGTFSSGIATIQCHYAPEFVSHTQGEKLTVIR